ncbi:TraA family conjugative transfer protein [Halomonas sp. E19]|uniref:TraA family conjugative transfer protein n=1 Tax=Halomonas sp. E19 TaxID=3397247 RepID=UPI0040336F0D
MQMITLMQRKGTIISMAAVFGAAALVLSDASFAGTGGGEFDDVWYLLEEWTQGTLGRIITLAIILVGAVMGVVRQSLMTFAVGFAMGMGLYNAPLIIDAIVGATLTNAGAIITTGQQITNGLGL